MNSEYGATKEDTHEALEATETLYNEIVDISPSSIPRRDETDSAKLLLHNVCTTKLVTYCLKAFLDTNGSMHILYMYTKA